MLSGTFCCDPAVLASLTHARTYPHPEYSLVLIKVTLFCAQVSAYKWLLGVLSHFSNDKHLVLNKKICNCLLLSVL